MPKLIIAHLWAVLFVAFGVALSPAAAQDGSVTYRVVKGDTLYGIAKRYLRTQSAALELQRINQVRNPRRMPVNRRLTIPRRLLRTRPVTVEVAAWSGPVTIGGSAPTVGAALRSNQRIVTGRNGFVSFRTSYGGRFSIPSNSRAKLNYAHRYVLNNLLDVDFEVERGRGSATSPTLKREERLRMRTPVATTAVRGTEYRVAYLPDQGISLAEVIEGNVAVLAGEEEQSVEAGFGVVSTEEGIGAQETLLPAVEFVKPGSVQTGEQLEFEIVPQSAAAAYRVQLARDAGFIDVIAEQVVTGPEATFESLEDRRYFVRARAVSQSRLEGNSQAYSFRRKRLGVSASVSPSPLADGFLFEWLPEGEGTSTYAFQLWNENSPQKLVIDETGLAKQAFVVTDLANGTYVWRVAVMQADAEEGLLKVWGAPQSLVVAD